MSHDGRRSLRIAVPDAAPSSQSILLQIPAAWARGREIRLSGRVRTARLRGRALLTLEAWKYRTIATASSSSTTPPPPGSSAEPGERIGLTQGQRSQRRLLSADSAGCVRGQSFMAEPAKLSWYSDRCFPESGKGNR
ncbi:MAG TPA: hypothetical protein VHG08_05845 [Longimicrobium sp.]|nr:hypothetical protein [Longimicrobium sp.]